MSSQTSRVVSRELAPGMGHPALPHPQGSLSESAMLESIQRAILNILEDFAAEKNSLERGQRAVLNILDDFDTEKAGMEGAQRAVLNILEDSVNEKGQLEAAGRSVLNILDDFSSEKAQLEAAQSATVNILDDFLSEKSHLEATQRAVLNILDDFDAEKIKVGQANQRLGREIEERGRVEEQVKKVNTELVAANKELEAFSYSVAHDLRGPLRGINGFSLALLEDYRDRLDDRGRDYLSRVRSATQQMGVLIDALLTLSRVARAEILRQSVDLTALAASIAGDLKTTQPERRVEFVIAQGLEAEGDPRLLRAVLENLLSNAWKFTSAHAHARIEFGRTDHDGRPAFHVRDDGAGFDPAYADRLFGAFQRLHSTSQFAGTGVGLATVQRIIHRHGGRIWAEGAVEQGATFYFTLEPN
ncbi:MAG TPA: ATP-binding protein [Candidatus Acidoferrales bacterium]|nr:ATP-binding protein [Candidatus Acidoferrales bacterium]